MGYYTLKDGSLRKDILYNHFWEEKEHQENMDDIDIAFCQGYDEGYMKGCRHDAKIENLERENEALRALMASNIRVIREDLRKELSEEKVKE
jgi:hypothetical protein